MNPNKSTDFGFRKVPEDEKAGKVAGVFSSVANRYDLMNDLMSAGLHRRRHAACIDQAIAPALEHLAIDVRQPDFAARADA